MGNNASLKTQFPPSPSSLTKYSGVLCLKGCKMYQLVLLGSKVRETKRTLFLFFSFFLGGGGREGGKSSCNKQNCRVRVSTGMTGYRGQSDASSLLQWLHFSVSPFSTFFPFSGLVSLGTPNDSRPSSSQLGNGINNYVN